MAIAFFTATVEQTTRTITRMNARANADTQYAVSELYGSEGKKVRVDANAQALMFLIGAFADEGEENLIKFVK